MSLQSNYSTNLTGVSTITDMRMLTVISLKDLPVRFQTSPSPVSVL